MGKHGSEDWLKAIEKEPAFAAHELCLRCGVQPADGLPCPRRLASGAIRSVRNAVDTEVKTGAYDALNAASGAVLHRRDGKPSTAGTARMYDIRDQLWRALVNVDEAIEGPTGRDRRGDHTIYEAPTSSLQGKHRLAVFHSVQKL